MKVLHFPGYITINDHNDLSRNTSGYGYATFDIAVALANLNINVELITQSYLTDYIEYEGVSILERKVVNIIKNIRLDHITDGIKMAFSSELELTRRFKVFFYHLSMGYFEKLINENNYDLVHIHGIGFYTYPVVNSCEILNVKYLVTLHGLNSFKNHMNVTPKQIYLERKFLTMAHQKKIPVTVVSSGIRNAILNYLDLNDSNNFNVINNAHSIDENINDKDFDLRENYGIPKNKDIILCVGNINERKNQSQVVRAYSLLPEKIKEKLVVLFLGKDLTNGQFENLIEEQEYSPHLIICGNISRDYIGNYYTQADYTIMPSIDEGFGLSIIEGFAFGLPNVAFSDLHVIPDVYDKRAMVLVSKRADKALADGINELCSREWDRTFIKKYSNNFSMDNVAEKYISVYKKMLDMDNQSNKNSLRKCLH